MLSIFVIMSEVSTVQSLHNYSFNNVSFGFMHVITDTACCKSSNTIVMEARMCHGNAI